MTTKARQLAELIANSLVDSDEISTGAVTTSKLASTLDFSSKTMVMADNQLSGDKIHGGTVSAFASTGIDDNASATAVTIASDGKVGIGTDSPTDALTVSGGNIQVDAFGRRIGFKLSGNSNAGYLIPYDGDGNTLLVNERSSGNLIFKSANTERMRIDASGNVGIGTSSPSNYHSSLNNLVIASSGDSGITIASGTSSEGSIAFADGTSGPDAYRGWINYNHNSNFMRFFTNTTEAMRINSSGNVGIGETSPDYRLEVKGTATTNTDIVGFSNSNGAVKHIFGLENVGAGRYSIRDASNNTAVFFSAHDADNSYVNAGSFLVGTTNADVGGSVTGIALKNTGAILASTDGTGLGAQPLYADRRGTNNVGDILMLGLGGYYKSSIGVLGTNSSSDNGGITFSTVASNVTKTERVRINNSSARAIVVNNFGSSSGQYGIGQGGYNGKAYTWMFANANYGSSGVALGFDNAGTITPGLLLNNGGNVGIGAATPDAPLQVGTEYIGRPYIDIIGHWRATQDRGEVVAASDGGGMSYTHIGKVVKMTNAVGSHSRNIGEVRLTPGKYYIVVTGRPTNQTHAWTVYGANSNGFQVSITQNSTYTSGSGYGTTYASAYLDQTDKNQTYAFSKRSAIMTVTSTTTYGLVIQVQPYGAGGYQMYVTDAKIMKLS